MDKAVMKVLLAGAGLPVPDYEVVRDREWRADPAAVLARVARLGLPVFVKPARGGSSIGITKVRRAEDVAAAITAARTHDPKVLVETAVVGREIECGVLEGLDGAPPQASLPAEIRVTGGQEFYDFDAKYLHPAEADVPADLPPALTEQVRDLAVRAYAALECEGLARVDFFITGGSGGAGPRVLVNEVNTMPGFTPHSMFPRMWAASGLDYPALVDRLIRSALERGVGLR